MANLQKEHFEILLENMSDNLQVVMEAFSGLNEKIDNNTAELAGQIQGLDKRLIRVEAKFDKVTADLDVHCSSTVLRQAPRKRPLKRV